MTREITETEARLLLWGQAFGYCAKLLTPDAAGRAEALEHLRDALGRLGLEAAQARLDGADVPEASLRDEHLRLFVKGEAPPYETSYEESAGSAGGKTLQLADIAGFYRAFGFQAEGERPDHIAPELEFVALLCVKEAYARLSGETDGAQICAETRAKFLREHLLPWLPAFQKRISREARHPVLPALADVLLAMVGVAGGLKTAAAG